MGGERPNNPEIGRSSANYTYDVRTLDKVWVFDVAKETWYEQETSGEVPPPRTQFCSVRTADPTANGTHHIYILGGADFKTKEAQYDV